MYPGSIFNLHDQSAIPSTPAIVDTTYRPLFLSVGSFDKGVEGFNRVYGQKFYQMYGSKMYFSKHGQNAIQTANLINAGAECLIYRVVAEDSTLANLVLVANVTAVQVQKTDTEGNPIYLDENGDETTVDTGNPVMLGDVSIKWEAVSLSNCKTYNEVIDAANDLFDPDNGVYPLMIFTDNGRGFSNKSVRIVADYNTSRTIGNMFYNAMIYEGTKQLESATISFDPGVQYSNTAYGLSKSSFTQVYAAQIENVYDAYVQKLADTFGVDFDVMKKNDLIMGRTIKGTDIDVEHFRVDRESTGFAYNYGTILSEGSNGSFGDNPITDAYNELMDAIKKVYTGDVDDRIYDVDEYRIVAVLDANFRDDVKDAISELASFRKDFMFFRDLGLEVTNYMEIAEKASAIENRDRYTSVMATTYQIKDPATYRNITVTANYDLATCLVRHFLNNAFNPLAGQFNGFILESAIEDTINFTPLITPKVNQKQAIDDLRINYAIFQGNQCTVQSEYTIQDAYTELSFTNNVIAIQEIMRAIRVYCPKIRFMTIDGYDMSAYAKAVNQLLSNFSGNFYRLYFEYTADRLRASQKIFYATIKVQFRPWEQTEEFDIFALGLEADIDGSDKVSL